MNKKIHMDIGGMTCISCQNRIEKALYSVNGVRKVKVSYSQGRADIECDENKTDVKQLVRAVEKLDYEVLSAGEKADKGIGRTFGILIIIAALYYLIQSFGLLNQLVPGRLADSSMGYGMLFLIGIITSVHCIAMCGGIGISQSLPGKGGHGSFLSNLLYNLGRVCSYTTIGFVLGLLGSGIGGVTNIGISSWFQGILKIVAGLFMVVMGINMLGIFPMLRRLSIHTPLAVARIIGEKRKTARGPFVIGLLNGLMPCGPLQAMWIVAFATSSPVAGALSMFMFSLGTVPLMLGLGSVISILGKKFTRQVMEVGAILVVVLGLCMLTQGAVLSGMQPVTNISSYMEMMIEDIMEPTRDRLKSCYDELLRLSGLITDLERLETAESSEIILEKEDINLYALSESILQGFNTRLNDKNITSKLEGDEVHVFADKGRIGQVLSNLLSNAVKYTDVNGSINVLVKKDVDKAVLVVEDTGIGIAKEDQMRVFERFYRTDKSRTRKTGGAGIGLTITKAIVQAHGGTIHCESEPGEGSRFIVTLPVIDDNKR